MADSFRLSEPQRGIYFGQQWQGNAQLYQVIGISRLQGALDPETVARAVATLHELQPALRLVFVEDEEGPHQVCRDQVTPDYQFIDLGALDETAFAAVCRSLVDEARAWQFDLERDVMLRVRLLKYGHHQFALLLHVHHVICDAWGISVIYNQLSRLVSAFNADPNHREPPQEGFFDYLPFEADYLAGARCAKDHQYWYDKIAPLQPFPLEQAFPRPKSGHAAKRVEHLLPQSRAIYAYCERHNQSVYTFFAALLSLYLHQISGLPALALGVSVLNRPRKQHKTAVGMFSNFIPLLCEPGKVVLFSELMQQIEGISKRDFRRQRYPIHRILTALDLSEARLTPVQFNYQNSLYDDGFGGVPHDPVWYFSESEEHVLTFNINDFQQGGIKLSLDYSTDVFDDIDPIFARLTHLIDTLLAAEDTPLRALQPMPLAERALIAAAEQGPGWPRAACHVNTLFWEQVAAQADRPALVQGDETWTYARLAEQARRYAAALLGAALSCGDAVVVQLNAGPEAVAAMWGIWAVGGVYVPVEPDVPSHRLAAVLAETEAGCIIAEKQDNPEAQITPAVAAALPPWDGAARVHQHDAAYVIFTSGSTGTPKGVWNNHAALAHYAAVFSARIGLSEQDRVAQQASLTFDTSLEEIVPVLCRGGCLVVLDRGALRDGTTLWRRVKQEGIQVLSTTPAVVALLNENPPADTPLRCLISGGDALQPEHYDRLPEALTVYNSYGPTETTVCATYADLRREGHHLGRPLPGYVVRVLDGERQPVPVGVTGEIHIGGRGVSLGYLKQPDAAEERFYRDGEQTWYRSGDLGKWDHAGRLHFVGRADRQISMRGFRIEPGEIEAALQRHPDIRAAALHTVGRGADLHLVAHIECETEPQDLRAFLATYLPDPMIPWRFIRHSELPRNVAGKINLQLLRETEATQQAPETAVPPRTASERALAEIWAEVLDTPIQRRDAHFFQAGGHSLKATRVVRAVAQRLTITMPLAVVFEKPRLWEQAAWLAQQTPQAPNSIPEVAPGGDGPLSHAQERLYLLQQREPDDTSYHLPLLLELQGAVDRDRLQSALQKVVARHEALRARFIRCNGAPRMVVVASMPWTLGGFVIEPDRVDAALQRDLFAPFDLEQGPLFRAALWQTAPTQAVLSLVFHHIISDATSIDLLLDEVVHFYNGNGSLPEAFPISRYAAWQRSDAVADAQQQARAFWRDCFAQPVPPLPLPSQSPRGDGLRPAGTVTLHMPPQTLAAFDAWLTKQEATRFMGYHAALVWLLYIYSNERDITIGAPVAARSHALLNESIGFYANTLALRCNFDPTASAAALLQNLRARDTAALEHADYPFDCLIETLGTAAEPGRSPLFDVMLVLLNTRDHYKGLDGIRAKRLAPPVRHAKFDWLFSFREEGDALFLDFEYDADRYPAERARHIATTLLALPALMIQDENKPLAQHTLVPVAPRQSVNRQYAKTSAYFEAMAAHYPNHIAVETEQDRTDYFTLHRRVTALVGQLQDTGVVPGDIVGVAFENPLERVVALLALLRAGFVFLPLDPGAPAERNAFAVADAGARVLLAEQRPDWAADTPWLRPSQVAPATVAKPYPAGPDHPAYLLYTSGSTGIPKAVLQTHRCLNHLIDWQLTELPGRRRVLQFAAFTFDVFLQETLFALCGGSTLILPDPETRRDLAALRRLIENQQVTVAFLPYTALRRVCEDALPEWGRRLRHVITAGEALIQTEALQQFLALRPNLTLHNHYGPTESHVVTAYRLPAGDTREQPPIGQAVGAVEARVCNEHGQNLPSGARGELWLAGPCLAAGYWQRPEQTAERFVTVDGRRWYRTGDWVTRDESGCFHFLGRIDNQVKIRGFRVECGEIEHHLLALDGITDAAVVKDEQDGNLWAWLVGDRLPDPARPRAALLKRLPEWMVPSSWMAITALPFTASGKIDRQALARRRVTGTAMGHAVTSPAGDAPRTDTERLLAVLWGRLLPGVATIADREADFFALGGNSISASRLAMALEQEHGMRLELRSVFAHPRLCDLARHLDFHREIGAFTPIPARPHRDRAPLSHAQRVMWTACQNPARARAYPIPAGFHLAGTLQIEALEQAFNDLIARHAALRTRFVLAAGLPQQVVVPRETRPLPLIETPSPTEARARAQAFMEQPFDLEQDSPLRAAVFSEGPHQPGRPGTYLAVFVIHHLVADGWSLDLLVRDWLTCCHARLCDQNPPPRLAAPDYADYAAWEQAREAWESREHATEIKAPPLFTEPLPETGNPLTGNTLVFTWDAALQQRLNHLARLRDAGLYPVLAATLAAALHRWTGVEHLALGVPIAARFHPDTRRMVGAFVQTRPLQATCTPHTAFNALLNQVRNDLVDLLDQPQADPRAAASLQVALVLQNTAEQDNPEFLIPGLTLEPVELFPRTNRLDLSFNLREHNNGISMQVEYDTRRFSDADIELLVHRWQALTDAALLDPSQPLDTLPFRAEAEQHQTVLLDVDFDF